MHRNAYLRGPALAEDPGKRTITDYLLQAVDTCPDETAFHLIRHGRPPCGVTYGELWTKARSLARDVIERGLARGDRVMLALPTGRNFFASFFGTILAGGTPVPAAPPSFLTKLEEYETHIARIASNAQADVVYTTGRAETTIRSALDKVSSPASVCVPSTGADPIERDQIHRPDPSEVCFLQYTSGSTSRPKGVQLTHANIDANITASSRALDIRSSRDCIISWLPLYHDMGLIGTVLTPLYNRCPFVISSPTKFLRDPMSWMQMISDYEGTIAVAPNFGFEYSLDRFREEPLDNVDLGTLRCLLNGAEPIDIRTIRQFQETFEPYGLDPSAVMPVYGLAESSLSVSFARGDEVVADRVSSENVTADGFALPAAANDRSRTYVSVGSPLAGQAVRIVDDAGGTVPERQIGEILVKGDSVMEGYFREPDKTEAALRNGWLSTGDYGYIADGRLYVTGRKKDVIIFRGKNYFPEDIERVIARLDAVRGSRVAVFEVDRAREFMMVVLTETRIESPDDRDRLRERIASQVRHSFQLEPDHVALLEPGELPTTTSGKIRRHRARELYEHHLRRQRNSASANTSPSDRSLALWDPSPERNTIGSSAPV